MLLSNRLCKKAKASAGRIIFWLQRADKEREPLLRSVSSSPVDSDISDDETETIRPGKPGYSTFSGRSKKSSESVREKALSYACASSISASIGLLVIAGILVSTRRRKAEFEVDIGVVLAVIAALMFAVMGIGCMIARREKVGWAYRTAVLLLAFSVLVVGLILMVKANISG